MVRRRKGAVPRLVGCGVCSPSRDGQVEHRLAWTVNELLCPGRAPPLRGEMGRPGGSEQDITPLALVCGQRAACCGDSAVGLFVANVLIVARSEARFCCTSTKYWVCVSR